MLVSILALLASLLGGAIGIALPDTDRVFSLLLLHRSLVTHSLLLPWLAYLCVQEGPRWRKAGVAGLCLTVAAHLSFDVFPRSWQGMALLHVPLVGQLNGGLSALIMGASMIGCCYLALRLLDKRGDLGTTLVVALLFFFLAARREQYTWGPLLLLVASFGAATFLPGSLIDGSAYARRWQAVAWKH